MSIQWWNLLADYRKARYWDQVVRLHEELRLTLGYHRINIDTDVRGNEKPTPEERADAFLAYVLKRCESRNSRGQRVPITGRVYIWGSDLVFSTSDGSLSLPLPANLIEYFETGDMSLSW